MAIVTALNCPNCHATISVGQNKCEYCGAGLIISFDNSSYSLRSHSQCSNCGAENEASSWFCLNCSTILTKDIEMLRRLQKKVQYEQNRVKDNHLPTWMRRKLRTEEVIHFIFQLKPKSDDFYLVTNERIIKNKKGLVEVPLSDVISLGNILPKIGLFSSGTQIQLETLKGRIDFDFDMFNSLACRLVWEGMLTAINDYNYNRKNIKEIILSLNLDDYSQTVVCSCGTTLSKTSNFCPNCGKSTKD
jgi:hypothetical protein